MPRKASQAAKKDNESKNESGSTRRSGRSVAKQDSSPTKEATRARRSSTAAQTAASVADSKSVKGRSGSRRDSTSPSEGRQRSRRESVESPATRVKSTRRASSRVNYKESDGEDEAAAPKYDETFESNEEIDDSESDEKSKSKGKKATKTPSKSRGAKDKGKNVKRGRGRAKKQSSDEESETLEISEDSVDAESKKSEEIVKESPRAEEIVKESPRAGRGRRNRSHTSEKSDDIEVLPTEGKRSSRRGASAPTKKETPATRKRPSRGQQAKRYVEEDEDDDDIEEIEPKSEEYEKSEEGSRKRKRSSTSETNKRLKETEVEEIEEVDDKDDDVKECTDEKDAVEKDSAEEPMDVDAPNSEESKVKSIDNESNESADKNVDNEKQEESQSSVIESSKTQVETTKQESISSENLDESNHSSESDQGSRPDQSLSSGIEDSQEAQPVKEECTEQNASQQESFHRESATLQDSIESSGSNSLEQKVTISELVDEPPVNNEQKMDIDSSQSETKSDIENELECKQNDKSTIEDSKSADISSNSVISTAASISVAVAHSNESNHEASLNGEEKSPSVSSIIHNTSVNLHTGDSVLKTNGAHEMHNNSVSERNQYYMFGRKYVLNAKLGESIQASVKDKSFGFASYNLSGSASEASMTKDKLLNELDKLDSHIICIQQVSQPFYINVLEPSLDVLGFKGTFTLPEDCEKGIATFYKNSFFRLSGKSETSLKNLIEKDLETASLETFDRHAVRSHLKNCGHVLFTNFATVIGVHTLTVANVMIPPTDLSLHALQVSCLVHEVVRINGSTSRPFLIGGAFNMQESEAPYQLLRDGYLSNDMIEELQRRTDVAIPGKENQALVNLLWKSFQHPSSTLCSCYKSVLDHEVVIPEKKVTSPDLLWYSSDSLYTVGVLDASENIGDHLSLKADIAFSV